MTFVRSYDPHIPLTVGTYVSMVYADLYGFPEFNDTEGYSQVVDMVREVIEEPVIRMLFNLFNRRPDATLLVWFYRRLKRLAHEGVPPYYSNALTAAGASEEDILTAWDNDLPLEYAIAALGVPE